MAVRVVGTADTYLYDTADSFDAGADDHLMVCAGGELVAVFHRNHWSRAEFVTASADGLSVDA